MSPRLFLQQNRAKVVYLNFRYLARFLRCQGGLAVLLVVLVLKSSHRAFLGLTRAEKKNIYESATIRSFFVYAYQLLRSVGTAPYIFFFSVSNSLALFNLLWDKNFRSHPEGIFTLLQKRNEMVHIACPRTVFSVAVILLDKTFRFQSLECRINRFLIHAALVGNESARWETVVGIFIAVPE